ncbi:hypothetical protein Nans01_43110 [Nocardiopsis ansamitocini]|uniref:Uncharacterized protein n=2 Tax=Nocardiopsis ansamitocini TaxID=1670832 RepID=A0A9W6P991_9ACTN|nr:hypothetical protein Nans01_43110 [Nocardiopsis ansamitocini]
MAVAALASVCAVGSAGAASADTTVAPMANPSECRYETMGDWGGRALCKKSNGGSFRAIVACKSATTGKIQYFYGPWAKTGTSTAYCSGDTRALFAGVGLSPTVRT